jgi:hypothetical protein
VHARDHEHGGADPTRIHYEDVGSGGAGGTGIQFDTDNEGGWLYVQANDETEAGGSVGGYAIDLEDQSSGGGIHLKTFNQLYVEANEQATLLSHNGKILVESDLTTGWAAGEGSDSIDIKAASGRIDVHGDSVEIQDYHGATITFPADGTLNFAAVNGINVNSAVSFNSSGGNLQLGASGDKIGFYGTAPISRPAHPATLADVINALVALGLVAP